MREIKFRAWLLRDKEMSEVLVLDNQEGKAFVVRKDGTAGWRFFAEIVIVEYTGIKGVGGVELYDGDIVEVFRDKVSEVVYYRGCFGLLTKGEFETFNDVYGYGEVIGNRFENPELLEG